jgi:hypothetical protein
MGAVAIIAILLGASFFVSLATQILDPSDWRRRRPRDPD